jgi:pyruvate formate lyase activating enzyme
LSGPFAAPAHHAPTRRLVAWMPAGMLDWPGKVSATLFLSGCSLRCPYCHNASLRTPTEAPMEWDDIVAHIDAKRSWLDGVVVTGGEPTEDPDLPSLLAALAEVGVPVKLDTNGTHPDVLRHVIAEQLVSFVALDVKATPAGYGAFARQGSASLVAQSVETVIRSGIEHEFRTTAYPGAVRLDDFPRIARALRGGRLYAVQQFRAGHTLDPHASTVRPYTEGDLRVAATACSAFLPTIVRGARAGEAA